MPVLARPTDGKAMGRMDGVGHHDGLAAGWSDRYRRGGFARRRRFLEHKVLNAAPVEGLWLDAGCGAGDFTRFLVAQGAQARGLDASAPMIAAARSRAPDIRFDQERAETLTDESAFDGLLCLSVLEYVDAPEAVLTRLALALKPGGRLVLSVPRRASLVRALQGLSRRLLTDRTFSYLASSRHAWDQAELVEALSRQGLAVETLHRFDPLLPRPLWAWSSLWVADCRKVVA